jgi:transcriptional regulator with XRE-family HTH domain
MRALLPLPSGDPVKVGAKLRATRRAQGLTIAQLADAAGVTKGFLSRIERDETSLSVATLVAICQVLSLPVGALFDSHEQEVIPLAAAPLINMGGFGAVERLLTPRSESRVQILRSVLEPGATGGADLYTINCEVEILHVLRGSISLRSASSTVDLVAGDTLAFPGTEPHTWGNPSRYEAEILWVIVPAAWSGSS